MSLLNQFLPKKESTNYFVVLGLEENHIRAAVAEITGNIVKILGTGEADFSSPETETEAVDLAVTTAEKQISEKLLVENVIFALPQIYIEGESVKPEYLVRLKKIAKELTLKVYGFVEYGAAIANYLTTVEGSAPTIMLLDLSESFLTATLVRIGRIVKTVIIERTDSLVSDFTKTLPQFDAEILPSRIIIFDFSKKSEDIREELLKFPWHKHSVFLHTPKMEILENKKILTAIVEASASNFLPNITLAEKIEETTQEVIPTDEVEPEKKEQTHPHHHKDKKFGFSQETLIEKPGLHQKETAPVENIIPVKTFDLKSKVSEVFAKVDLDRFKNIIRRQLPNFRLGGFAMLIPAVIIVFILFYIFQYYPKATIYLLTYPQKSDQSMEVTFVKESGTSTGDVINTRSISEEVSGSRSAKTTGTNQIGEKARGEVTIYNKQTSGKNVPKGSVILSGPLKFTLDEDVKIASASESTEGITFGRTSIKVTAVAIGPESNLASSSNFTFQDTSLSVLTAKNNQSFSGGTSRDIDSVSKTDRDNLEAELVKQLITEGKQKMLKNLDLREKILDEPVNTIVSSKKFSHEVGNEAKEVSLDLTLKVEALAYNQDNLETKANSSNLSVPTGFKLDPGRFNVKVASSKTNKNGDIEANIIITSYFIPDIDLEKIKNEIKGKNYNDATSILENQGQIGGVRIIADSSLPFLGNRIPQQSKNINLIVSSK